MRRSRHVLAVVVFAFVAGGSGVMAAASASADQMAVGISSPAASSGVPDYTPLQVVGQAPTAGAVDLAVYPSTDLSSTPLRSWRATADAAGRFATSAGSLPAGSYVLQAKRGSTQLGPLVPFGSGHLEPQLACAQGDDGVRQLVFDVVSTYPQAVTRGGDENALTGLDATSPMPVTFLPGINERVLAAKEVRAVVTWRAWRLDGTTYTPFSGESCDGSTDAAPQPDAPGDASTGEPTGSAGAGGPTSEAPGTTTSPGEAPGPVSQTTPASTTTPSGGVTPPTATTPEETATTTTPAAPPTTTAGSGTTTVAPATGAPPATTPPEDASDSESDGDDVMNLPADAANAANDPGDNPADALGGDDDDGDLPTQAISLAPASSPGAVAVARSAARPATASRGAQVVGVVVRREGVRGVRLTGRVINVAKPCAGLVAVTSGRSPVRAYVRVRASCAFRGAAVLHTTRARSIIVAWKPNGARAAVNSVRVALPR